MLAVESNQMDHLAEVQVKNAALSFDRGHLSGTEFVRLLVDACSAADAGLVYASLTRAQRSAFDWAFVAEYGDRLARKRESMFHLGGGIAAPHRGGEAWRRQGALDRHRDVVEAFHRLVLASRETS